MSGAAAQVRRLLNLVPYLLEHEGAKLTEVAGEFNVSEKQLRKDLETLWMCGLPGGLPDDLMEAHIGEGGTIHLENAEAIVRPLRFSVREAVALLVALRALAQLPGVADRDALLRAIAKLEEARRRARRGGLAAGDRGLRGARHRPGPHPPGPGHRPPPAPGVLRPLPRPGHLARRGPDARDPRPTATPTWRAGAAAARRSVSSGCRA